MMMMACLWHADFMLEAQNLRAVLAQRAVHGNISFENFGCAFREHVKDQRVIAKIVCPDKLNAGIAIGNNFREAEDPVHENAAKEEIRKHDNALVTKPDDMLETGLDQGESHSRITHLAPSEAHPFPEHAGEFRYIAVCIRIGCATADHDQASSFPVDDSPFTICHFLCARDAHGGCPDQHGGESEFATIVDSNAVFACIGVEHGGNVVLGVHGGKQHSGNSQDPVAALPAQTVKPVTNDRVGKFEIAVCDWPVRQPFGELRNHSGEFIYRVIGA